MSSSPSRDQHTHTRRTTHAALIINDFINHLTSFVIDKLTKTSPCRHMIRVLAAAISNQLEDQNNKTRCWDWPGIETKNVLAPLNMREQSEANLWSCLTRLFSITLHRLILRNTKSRQLNCWISHEILVGLQLWWGWATDLKTVSSQLSWAADLKTVSSQLSWAADLKTVRPFISFCPGSLPSPATGGRWDLFCSSQHRPDSAGGFNQGEGFLSAGRSQWNGDKKLTRSDNTVWGLGGNVTFLMIVSLVKSTMHGTAQRII